MKKISSPSSLFLRWFKHLLFFFLVVGGIVMACIEWQGWHDELEKADVGVVPGNKVELDGTPSPALESRLRKTLELYRAGYFQDVFVSGGLGKEGFDEAVVMRDWLVREGVPTEHVFVDSEGRTTRHTAQNLVPLAVRKGWKTAFVVTQHFHISRTCRLLSQAGIKVMGHAHSDYVTWRDMYSLPREAIGLGWYYFR